MAFDLSTAKKVEDTPQEGADRPFDITTAKPVKSTHGRVHTNGDSGSVDLNLRGVDQDSEASGNGALVERQKEGENGGGPSGADQRGNSEARRPTLEPEQSLASLLETGAALAGAVITEPVAGVAGTIQSLNPFAEDGAGAATVDSVRQAGQEFFAPQTDAGKENLHSVGEVLKPVGDALGAAEKILGDTAFEATGSPAIAAAATTLPTAALELLGLASFKGFTKTSKAITKERAAKGIAEASPSIDELKDVSRAIYKEIDDLKVSVRPKAFDRLVKKTRSELNSKGLDADITPKSAKALKRLEDAEVVTVSDVDTLRQVARNAAGSIEKTDAMLGSSIIDNIDDFLDNKSNLLVPDGADIGARYRVARNLWGRARKSEIIQDAIRTADNNKSASGFENQLRVQFRRLLNNKKKIKGFSKDEVAAIRKVAHGGKGENLARLVGRLAFGEGGSHNMLMGTVGASIGGVIGGVPGAIAVPVIGQVSRGLAARLTAKNAMFADDVVRAGSNAVDITKAYIKHTPKSKRNPKELAELFTRPDVVVDIQKFQNSPLAKQAANIARRNRELAAASMAGVSASLTKEFDEES